MSSDYQHDVIHISPGLVKWLAGSILTSLVAIAGYMALWALDDRSFKAKVITHMDYLERSLNELKTTVSIIPANTQRIENMDKRIDRLEDGSDQRPHR